MFFLVAILSILLIPSIADAWGPLTHVYLGYRLIDLGAALVPAAVYGILKKYRNDFLYGNLCADIILGRRFQGREKNSHNWDVAWRLLDASRTDRQRVFAYGYLMHLGADSVIHNLKSNRIPFHHSMIEVRSDSIIDNKYRRIMKHLDKYMQKRHDIFLEGILESLIFSFRTNKRIFKGFLVLSRLPNYTPVSHFFERRFPDRVTIGKISEYRQESLGKMIELLQDGGEANVLKSHPLGRYRRKAS